MFHDMKIIWNETSWIYRVFLEHIQARLLPYPLWHHPAPGRAQLPQGTRGPNTVARRSCSPHSASV